MKDIDIVILEIANPKPKIHSFTNYKDFMKNRNIVPYYKFNKQFLNHLVELAESVWNSQERINKTAMLETLNLYLSKAKTKIEQEIRERIFLLHKDLNHSSEKLSRQCYRLVKYLPRTEEAENWLCQRVDQLQYFSFLNKILRYPDKSAVISRWVADNYNSDILRTRRAEAVAWLLNENPNFVVENQTLIDDFEYFNSIDAETIKERSERAGDSHISLQSYSRNAWGGTTGELIRRPYIFVTYELKPQTEPDFSKLRSYFYTNFNKIKSQAMLWAIAYSHLSEKEKLTLMKKFYLPELFVTTFNIGKKYKLLNLLRWLKKQPANRNNYHEYHIELGNITIPEKPITPQSRSETLSKMINTLDLEIVDNPPFLS